MRRGQQKAASPGSNGNGESSVVESFRIDAVVGKSDQASRNPSVGSVASSTGGKSHASSLGETSLASEKGTLSKKKKRQIIQLKKHHATGPPRPHWLTAFYLFITVASMYGILSNKPRDDNGSKDGGGLKKIQYMAPSPDEFASLRRDSHNQTQPESILPAPTNEYHLFHIAPVSNLGNNLLNSILMGMFDKQDAFYSQVVYNPELSEFETWHHGEKADCTVTVVSQTNVTDVLILEKNFGKVFQNVFFVALKSPRIPDCAAPPENMICFDYNEMAYENKVGRAAVVQAVIKKLQGDLRYFSKLKFDKDRMDLRLDGLEKAIGRMLDRPVNEIDSQYGTHGQQPLEEPELEQDEEPKSPS